ncbi:MAG: hypothetical protein ACOC42_01835 [Halobacteriota archaeon]
MTQLRNVRFARFRGDDIDDLKLDGGDLELEDWLLERDLEEFVDWQYDHDGDQHILIVVWTKG